MLLTVPTLRTAQIHQCSSPVESGRLQVYQGSSLYQGLVQLDSLSLTLNSNGLAASATGALCGTAVSAAVQLRKKDATVNGQRVLVAITATNVNLQSVAAQLWGSGLPSIVSNTLAPLNFDQLSSSVNEEYGPFRCFWFTPG